MIRFIYYLGSLLLLLSCSGKRKVAGQLDELPPIYPDYIDVAIPQNIAPLNFMIKLGLGDFVGRFEGKDPDASFDVVAKDGMFDIPMKKWKTLLSGTAGSEVKVTILKKINEEWISYRPFSLYVMIEPIDSHLVYRLIEPGYALWNQMGIYQRDLTCFKETAVYENKMGRYNCVNCHSFCMQDPDKMLLHLRSYGGGTVFAYNDQIEKIDSRMFNDRGTLAYPYWHPDGRYVAISTNKTTQDFHPTQRVEVFDMASDVVVYDRKEHRLIVSEAISSAESFETFPSFSPDGRTLYYCTAPACPMPDSIRQLKYSLCSVPFDPDLGVVGIKADTLYNGEKERGSLSFPRVSPDGRFLMCTRSGYGTFPIWHKDADLYMIDLTREKEYDLDVLNSEDTESYHSWSSNGRWVVFSSRRLDGLYTRPFIAYVDTMGKPSKPFLLPQRNTDYYAFLMKSYNLPEFVKGNVNGDSFRNISEEKAKKE